MDADAAERLRKVIAKLARHLNADATAEGLTPTQASVLGVVVARGPVRVADIVAVEGLNPTMLSRVLGKLEDLGLILRSSAPGDLRVVSVVPTVRGHELHERLKKDRAKSVARLVSQLEPAQRQRLEESLPVLEMLAKAAKRATATEAAPPRGQP